MIIYYHIHKS